MGNNTDLREASASVADNHYANDPYPPRRVKHPSNKKKLTRHFVQSLIVLFILLMIGLIVWGNQLKWER